MKEIRLGSTDSVFSHNTQNRIHVDIEQTGKKLPLTDVTTVIDQYDVYRTEASACNKYRLALTINPYCTNVLFNTCTEVIFNEGSDKDVIVYRDDRNSILPVSPDKVHGKTSSLRRHYMVDNTEYSCDSVGCVYHPGYDIFGNHVMRNLSFRTILPKSSTSHSDTYNTIEDTMRDINGKDIMTYPRLSPSDTTPVKKHLYENGNILSMENGDSVSENLFNENGWYGFYNNSGIKPKIKINNGLVETEANHVINNMGNCEFVDMYPDRTLYSFTPKFNRFRNRTEKNWDVFITYPYANFYRHNLVTNVYAYDVNNEQSSFTQTNGDMQTNGLLVMEALSQYCRNGMEGVQFRSFCKHNLNQNNYVYVYYSLDKGETYKRCSNEFRVNYIGDMRSENNDYYFAITNSSVLDEILESRIPELFYGETMTAPEHFRNMNGKLTEIPQELDTTDDSYEPNICLWYYNEVPNEPYIMWDDTNTFDTIPMDVQNGPTYVRVRKTDGDDYAYVYYKYKNNQYQMLDYDFDPETEEFGNGNTFNDIPVGYVTDYIRVYKYNFYRRMYKYYIQKSEKVNDIINSLLCTEIPLRFAKVTNGFKCEYYIRMFRKLPNMSHTKEDLNNAIASNSVKFDEYIQRNCTKNGKMRDFNHEVYPLAFAKTIYGDDITQYQYTDTFDTAYIRDNRNRPLTEMYVTVVKKNKGYKEWYEEGNYTSSEVEYSHAFGKVTSGLDFLCEDDDDSDLARKVKGFLSDSKLLTNVPTGSMNGQPLEFWGNVNMNGGITEGITEDDEVFFGDVVEYNPMTVIETSLSDVQFRFNTAQRENGDTNQYTFTYKEIVTDDSSEEKFHTEEHVNERPLICPEGYYYKAHYRIPVKSFSENVRQASHFSVMVKNAEPKQMNGIYIRVVTTNNHGYSAGRKVFICNDEDGVWYNSSIVYVDSKTSFIINPISKDVEAYEGKPYIDWITTCKMINDKSLRIRVGNEAIPDYADNVSKNLFMWREVIPAIDSEDEEVNAYPYANSALYIDKGINLFLRRQDPEVINGLYYYGTFPDVSGKIEDESNYEYIPENRITC